MGLGVQTKMVGPNVQKSYLGKITWEQRNHFRKQKEIFEWENSRWFWVPDSEITVILDKDGDWGAGFGSNIGLGYDITKDLSAYLGGGFLIIFNSDDLEGIGDAPLSGKIKTGIRYKKVGIFFEHISQPFRGGNDTPPDVGKNYFGFEYCF